MPIGPNSPSPTVIRHLKEGSASPEGQIGPGATTRSLRAMLAAGFVYREDADGFRMQSIDEALHSSAGTPYLITLAGRAATLSTAQRRALTGCAPDERLAPGVTWATAAALAALRLVEYRDADGQVQPSDGDNGVDGPKFAAYRTELGRQVSALVLPGGTAGG